MSTFLIPTTIIFIVILITPPAGLGRVLMNCAYLASYINKRCRSTSTTAPIVITPVTVRSITRAIRCIALIIGFEEIVQILTGGAGISLYIFDEGIVVAWVESMNEVPN
jgi:hypothetical protein